MSESILLRLPQVRERTGLSRTEIYRRINQGIFPQRVRLGRRIVAWRSQEIDPYLDQLAAVPEKGSHHPGMRT